MQTQYAINGSRGTETAADLIVKHFQRTGAKQIPASPCPRPGPIAKKDPLGFALPAIAARASIEDGQQRGR